MAKKAKNRKTQKKRASPSKKKASGTPASKMINKIKRVKIKEKVMFEIPHYPQSEEFTSSAACAMMILKYINPEFKFRKENEYSIWQESVNGSVWHGSKYGIAYALAKRGAKVGIISNTKDEGYDKKMAVYENVNLDALASSFNEIKNKAYALSVEEQAGAVSIQTIKKVLSANLIPIILIDANVINSYLDASPQWIVVKGYDKDAFYINDPYSDSTITIDHNAFKGVIGFDNDTHLIFADAKYFSEEKEKKRK